jgi:hypothetical protein
MTIIRRKNNAFSRKDDPESQMQEIIALTKEKYLSFIEAEKNISLGDKECTTEHDENNIQDIKEEAYQKYLKKPEQLQPQEYHISRT